MPYHFTFTVESKYHKIVPALTVEKDTNPSDNSKVHLTDEEMKKMKFVIEKIFSGIGKMAGNSLSECVVPASVKNESFANMCNSKPAFYTL